MTNARRITSDMIANPWLIGFENIIDQFANHDRNFSYPPHNIYYDGPNQDSDIIIDIALAGLDKNDIKISETDEKLSIKYSKNEGESVNWIHKGISSKDFLLEWALNQSIKVKSATWKDGMLSIRLEKDLKESTRTIEIE